MHYTISASDCVDAQADLNNHTQQIDFAGLPISDISIVANT